MGILDSVLADPTAQFGLGLLANNMGRTRGEAFGNALQGGLQTYGWGQQLQANQAVAAMREMEMRQKMAQQQQLQGLLADIQANPDAYGLTPEMARLYAATGSEGLLSESGRPVQVMGPNGPVWMKPRDAYGQPAVNSQWGVQITGYDESGRPLMSMGPGASTGALSKTTITGVEKDIIGLDDQLEQLYRVRDAFEPRYQTLAARFGNKLADWKSFAGMDLAPEERSELEGFAAHRAESGQNFATVVKSQAGTAMTAQEATRVEAYVPNPGTGLFDGDSPDTFRSKMAKGIERLEWARMRKVYYLRHGIRANFAKGEAGPIDLENVPSLIRQRGNAIEAEARKAMPGATDEQIVARVKAQLAEEFGIR